MYKDRNSYISIQLEKLYYIYSQQCTKWENMGRISSKIKKTSVPTLFAFISYNTQSVRQKYKTIGKNKIIWIGKKDFKLSVFADMFFFQNVFYFIY